MGKAPSVLKADGSMRLGTRALKEWQGPSSAVDFDKVRRDVVLWWDNSFRLEMLEFCMNKGFHNRTNPCLEASGCEWSCLDTGAQQRVIRSYIQWQYSDEQLLLWRQEGVITEAQQRVDMGLPAEETAAESNIITEGLEAYKERRARW